MSYELVTVTYAWNDEPDQHYEGVVCIGETQELDEDDGIFFYVRDNQDLALLTYPNNGEDFIIVETDKDN